jgi:hypothetical protein
VDQSTHNKIVSFTWGITDEISADVLAIEKEAEGLLDGLLTGMVRR